jgi:hypothetical protein
VNPDPGRPIKEKIKKLQFEEFFVGLGLGQQPSPEV